MKEVENLTGTVKANIESNPDDLIAEFMHELKTRLMAVTAAGEILSRGDLDDSQRELVAMVQDETMRLAKMAQDFLELARLEAGQANILRQPVDLSSLLEDATALSSPGAQEGHIDFQLTLPKETITILGDYDRLKMALLNIIGNAMKYVPPGGWVSVEGRIADDNILILVRDNGPGIAPEHLPMIFNRFYRVADSEGFTEGAGLGLSIASRIFQEHGGRIAVTSEVGQGSAFYCYLPGPADLA